MNLIPIQESACHYLFGKEASEIFNSPPFPEEFINQSLDTLIRVNVAFLSRKTPNGLPFIDPAAFNNQCHLYSFSAINVIRDYKERTFAERLEKTQENRFLHLSFLLSYTFLTDRPLLCQAIQKASQKGEVDLPANQKLFYNFVKDSQGTLIRTARKSLNEMFERYIKNTFAANQERSLLHKELHVLSLENLQLLPDRGKETLYTLPKLAGVAFLINENFSFVIKTKIINSNGTGTLFYQSGPIGADEPVLVFETMASDELSIDDFRKIAERCPSYFERKSSRKHRHKETDACLFCNPAQIDVKPFQERFESATVHIQDTLYALGADFLREIQIPYLKFFQDREKYPILTEIFQRAVSDIDKFGLSMRKPMTFTVDHVYADNGEYALSAEFRMNSSPENYLKARGFL